MTTKTATDFDQELESLGKEDVGVPALLVAHSFFPPAAGDRFRLPDSFMVGTKQGCHLVINDDRLSRNHFVINKKKNKWIIEDLNSKNGTYVNGQKLKKSQKLSDNDTIIASKSIFIFHSNVSPSVFIQPIEKYGMAGKFYLKKILLKLKASSLSKKTLLLTGPSGIGKEFCARAFSQMVNKRKPGAPFVVVHAGRFGTEEQTSTALFGVAKGVFSNVYPQSGLVESAEGGVLFLDEIQLLSHPMQGKLLRVVEYGDTSRIGDEIRVKKSTTRFVFASNISDGTHGLKPDLHTRVQVIHLEPLHEKIAEIPTLFLYQLKAHIKDAKISEKKSNEIIDAFGIHHFELLCRYGFRNDNVRGITNLCDRIISNYQIGVDIQEIINDEFVQIRHEINTHVSRKDTENSKTSKRGAGKIYESHKETILSVFKETGDKYSQTERILKEKYNLKVNRHTLSTKIKKWTP